MSNHCTYMLNIIALWFELQDSCMVFLIWNFVLDENVHNLIIKSVDLSLSKLPKRKTKRKKTKTMNKKLKNKSNKQVNKRKKTAGAKNKNTM